MSSTEILDWAFTAVKKENESKKAHKEIYFILVFIDK
jgi:hypothetical protein